MPHEKYSVDWFNYSFHLREMLQHSLKTNELADVTLVCDDKKQFKAHKIVLSAFSSVFKSIINDLPPNNPFVYLKGIQHQELELILEYMYLGEATFNQERMNEFLDVAKNLEIKGITEAFTDENKSKHYSETPESKSEYETPENNINEKDLKVNNPEEAKSHNITQVVGFFKPKENFQLKTSDGLFSCNECDKKFSTKKGYQLHFESIHEGVKYGCDKCDYKATTPSNLTVHMKAKHEGVKFDCNQCNYRATFKIGLKHHIASKHEGVKYACKQCDYQATQLSHLKTHYRVCHNSFIFSCEKCNQQFENQTNLYRHMKSCGIV